jgi:carboxyl-terminal processing protease
MLLICLLPCVAFAGGAGDEEEDWFQPSTEKFESGERAFQAARRELLENYVKDGLTEDDLYRAAVQGMLTTIDPAMHKYNRLMGPAQFAEMSSELKGEVMGIGIHFNLDKATGRGEVLGVIAGGPAAAADVRDGDLVLSVDGQSLKGKSMMDAVYMIRGKAGSTVKLTLLRDTSVIEKTVTRAKVTFELVQDTVLPGDVGVLSLQGFSDSTPGQVRAALERLQKAGVKGLIIDLRFNEGGVLDKAVETARLLIPKGHTLAKLVKRGGKEETLMSDATPILSVPMVVLISDHTASSSELLAGALHDSLKAPLIGAHTRGKWSVQMIKQLPNGYVMKYTVAHFKDASGKGYEGVGLMPDIEVPMTEEQFNKAHKLKGADRLNGDPQLKAATNFLRMR